MKRKIVMILCTSILMGSMVACGEKSEAPKSNDSSVSADQEVSVDNTKDEAPEIKEEDITMDSLREREPNSESDFEIMSNGDGTCQIQEYVGTSSVIVVPDKINGDVVKSVHVYAFANNDKITAVKFSDSIEEIGGGVCGNCTSLKYVICGSGTKKIGEGAFVNTGMEELELNEGLEELGTLWISGSYDDWSIKITIPESVTKLTDFGGIGVSVRVKAGSVAEELAKDSIYEYETY